MNGSRLARTRGPKGTRSSFSKTGPPSPLARIRGVIRRVPRGRVMTYGGAAAAAGYPRGARLTVRALWEGEALPWHRIVAAGGRIALTGEGGQEQRLRLAVEGVVFRGGRVRMDLHAWTPPAKRSASPGRRSRRRARAII